MDSGNAENAVEFKQFEVVAAEPKDHHYLNKETNGQDAGSKANSFQTIVIKEWKILEENLPDAIYVRAYETRTDLLRAVIIGAPETPYHNGLFFFDIFLPQNYPNTPPQVHYHSHGHRLNPNLYESGYVCLSLVNTWSGSEEERWSVNSTLLQVLVSIQGMVLNERPFFNEPGYEAYQRSEVAQWMNDCIRYNEKAFILSCKTLVQIVKRPPMGFEDFVVGHFRGRVPALLAAVEGYQGSVVKPVMPAAERTSSSSQDFTKYKTDLANVHRMIGDTLVALDDPKNDSVATLEEERKRSREESEEEDESEDESGEEEDGLSSKGPILKQITKKLE